MGKVRVERDTAKRMNSNNGSKVPYSGTRRMSRAMMSKALLFHRCQKAFLLVLSKSGSSSLELISSGIPTCISNLMRIEQGVWQEISQWGFFLLQVVRGFLQKSICHLLGPRLVRLQSHGRPIERHPNCARLQQ